MSQNKTTIGELNINNNSVYTVENFKKIFMNLAELDSSKVNQQDIVNVLNKIIKVFKYGTGEVIS